jgi:Tol biopolymer transport system component
MSKRMSILVCGAVVLAGCNPESPRTGGDGDVLAAGVPGAVAAQALAEQDSTPLVARRVWGGQDVDLFGGVSPDGRYVSFVDWESGNIAVRELATGETRLVTDEGSMSAPRQFTEEGSVISPDGRSLCYDWFNSMAEAWRELRVTDLRGSEYRAFYHADVGALDCAAWSPDGEYVAAVQGGEDGTQLVLVSVADGSARTLKGWDSGWPTKVSFSPDGRYIVYDRPKEADGPRDIFVFSFNGGRETALVEHPANDVVLSWAPDGRHILFASDRTGTLGAWLMPVADGRPTGQARLVKPDMWRVRPLGFTRDGSFYYGVNMTARSVYVASLDPETGEMLAAPAAVSGDYYEHERLCDWSPDGRYLLYWSARRDGGRGYAYSIRSVETGEIRQLVPDLDAFIHARWSPDGYSLIVPGGWDREGRPGVYRVDVQTGDSEPLAPFDDPGLFDWFNKLIDVSPDGRKVYYTGITEGGAGITVMDLESGSATLLSETVGPGLDPWALSPDGEYVAFATEDSTLHRLMIVPTAGGEARELHRYEAEASWVQSIAWSRDGKHLLYSVRGDPRLWRIGVDGGPAEETGLSGEGTPAHIRVHRDGRRIAFDSGSGGAEVWVMENFLPRYTGGE